MFTLTTKRLFARFAIAAVLFTQFAVASYACPTADGPARAVAAALAEEMRSAMPDCDMAANGNLNLCVQHCQAGDQSVQTLPQIEVPAFAAISGWTVVVPLPRQRDHGITVVSALPERETSPPPLVRFGVLRI
jgi:hypothetical protein